MNELQNLDKTTFGEHSSWSTIVADNLSVGDLFEQACICPAFTQHNIKHSGVMNAQFPFGILRLHQSGTFFMACIEGGGEVLIDGVWRPVNAGQSCLLPPHMINGLRAIEGTNWKFAWVRYAEDKNKKNVANSHSPTIGEFNCESVVNVVQGLNSELKQCPHESVVSCWVNLLHQQVLKFANPRIVDDRLKVIWNQVVEDLSRDWTLFELSKLGFISEEHLRRLNNSQIGRSPMQHLIYLRMVEARRLLIDTNDTVESICLEVGYKNPFSFSNTFQKWMGCRPSALR